MAATKMAFAKFLVPWAKPIAGTLAAVTIGLMVQHLRSGAAFQNPEAVVQAAVDSATKRVAVAEAKQADIVVRVDTIIQIVRQAPTEAVARAEAAASAALAHENLTVESTQALRATYDAALAHKDSIIASDAIKLADVGRLAAQMQALNAEARLQLSSAHTALAIVPLIPPAKPGCGVYCTVGRVVVWAGTGYAVYRGIKLVVAAAP